MTFTCKLPWQAVQIDRGLVRPCCAFSWNSNPPQTFDAYIQHPELATVRQLLSQGQAPAQCQRCVFQEKLSGHSHRTYSNQFENTDPENEFEDVFIVVSNTCNLKCTSCLHSSYVRRVEMHKLGIIQHTPVHVPRNPNINFLVNHPIKTLTLSGGEPLVDSTRELLDGLIKNKLSQNIELRLNSNCTHLNADWLDYLSGNFKTVMIKASLDGVGAVNDYLRYPSDWADIAPRLNLIDYYANVSMIVTAVLTNASLIRFYELIEWCVGRGIHDLFVLTATEPAAMQPTVLPKQLKDQLLIKYNDLKLSHHTASDRIKECIDACIEACDNDRPGTVSFSESLAWYRLHDQHRGTDLFKTFAELKPYE